MEAMIVSPVVRNNGQVVAGLAVGPPGCESAGLTIPQVWSNARQTAAASILLSATEFRLRNVTQTETPGIASFRKLMGRFATGVCVVAVDAGEHGVSGMTVNSFVSVSLDPMLVSWSLQNRSSQFELYAKAPRFSISILSDDQAELAQRYASRADSELRRGDFIHSNGGLPVVSDALGHIECALWSNYRAGDHTLIFGEVTGLDFEQSDNHPARAPLGFFDGRFCRIEQ